MPANNRYVKRWRNWIEKKKLLTKEEIDEIETYLIDKMESIQNQMDISDRSAFNQALDIMGEQGLLAEEYTKIRKSPFDKLKWWVMAQTTVSVFLVIFIFISQFGSNNTATFQWNIFAYRQNNIKSILDKDHFDYRCFDRGSFQVIRVKNCHPEIPTYDILFLKDQTESSTEFKFPVAVIQYFYGLKKFSNPFIITPSKDENQFLDEYFPLVVFNTDNFFIRYIQKCRTAILSAVNDIIHSTKFVYHCYIMENNSYENNDYSVAPVTLQSEIEKSFTREFQSKTNRELVSFKNR